MSSGDFRPDKEIAAKALDWDDPFALLDYDAGDDLVSALADGIFWAHHVVTMREPRPKPDPRARELASLIRRRRIEQDEVGVRFEERRADGLPSWWLSPQEQRELAEFLVRSVCTRRAPLR